MIHHVTGDLVALADAGEFDIVVHGCNCFNTMGAGIAKQLRTRWPDIAKADAATIKGNYNKLGTFSFAYIPDADKDFLAINAYTQYKIRREFQEDVFEYTSFKMILQKLYYLHGCENFGFPKIGMGLAGGDENRIMSMLNYFSEAVDKRGGSVTLVTLGE